MQVIGTLIATIATSPLVQRIAVRAWGVKNPETAETARALLAMSKKPTLENYIQEFLMCRHYDPECQRLNAIGKDIGDKVTGVTMGYAAALSVAVEDALHFPSTMIALTSKVVNDDTKLAHLLSIDLNKQYRTFVEQVQQVWWATPNSTVGATMNDSHKQMAAKLWTVTIANSEILRTEATTTEKRAMFDGLIKVGKKILRNIRFDSI